MAIKFNRAQGAKAFVSKYKLAPLLDNAIVKYRDEPWSFEYTAKEDDDAWHPSGHCTPTAIELYEIATQEAEDLSRLAKAFAVGHLWHQWLQHIVTVAGYCEPESVERRGAKWWGDMVHRVSDEDDFPPPRYEEVRDTDPESEYYGWYLQPKPYCWVTGSADIAPATIPGHGEFIIDFKTMGGHDFKYDHPPERFADKWECQVNVYMDFFDIERGIMVGCQKDSPHEFKEWEYHRNQPLIDKLYEKWEFVSHCLDEGLPPKPDDDDYPHLTTEFDDTLPLRGPSV